MIRSAALLTLTLLAGCAGARAQEESAAARQAAELSERLAGRSVDEGQRCVEVSRLGGPEVIGQTLVYTDGGRLWRNDPQDGCPFLRGDPVLITEVYGSQVCRGDRFRTTERGGIGIPSGYCRFGDFVPYTRPKD